MPREKREESPTGIYHWIVRGMNQRSLFMQPKDYLHFKDLVREYKSEYAIQIYHYCLMGNHVHQLLYASAKEKLARFSYYVQRRYAYYVCKEYRRTGSIFRRRYKSLIIDREEYLLECGRYIERNPIKAGIVKKPEDYIYSSYRYYTEGISDALVTPSPAYIGLSKEVPQRRLIYGNYVKANRIYEVMRERGLLTV